MTSASFSFIRVELPVQDDTGQIVSSGARTMIAALTPDTQLRQMLALAHTMTDAVDRLAAEIADLAGVDADSDQITDAVYSCSDVDEALSILLANQSKDRPI